jgi:twitching motility protein PilT
MSALSEPRPTPINQAPASLDRWLEELKARNGSDLLLVPGVPPCLRIAGIVERLSGEPLSGEQIQDAILPTLTGHARSEYEQIGISDSSYRVPSLGRFRVNLHRERGQAAATIRALPSRIPSVRELNLPTGVEQLAALRNGLVLIGGAAGSGKSTTVAALVNEINQREARHIVTIEDPLEYEHRHGMSVIEQVEIGVDAPDFPTALRAALRQAPDILVVGEMRDPETMHIAVAAAETGHLVLSTLHTTDIPSTISRLSDSFPAERQNTIRQELAMALSGVFVQMLLPSKNGGRVPAGELLMVGYGARQHIRRNALQHLQQEITLTKNKGSFSLEDNLAQMVSQNLLDREQALLAAHHPDDLKSLLRT